MTQHKIKIFTAILFCIALGYNAQSQSVDYNKIILPEEVKGVGIEEVLVRMAWNNHPSNKQFEYKTYIQEKHLKMASWEWLNNLRVQFNINEFTINPNVGPVNRADYYPKYNISAFIRMGQFVTIPAEKKIAKSNLEVALLDEQVRMLELRADVLRKYQIYLRDKELYKISNQLYEESYSDFLLVEQQFKDGEITLDDYNKYYNRYINFNQDNIRAKATYQLAIIDLEMLIGVELSNVIKD